MHSITMDALLALQCFVVLFLFLHDWVPLGSLNDLKGVSTADSFGKRVAATLISAVPFAVGLIGSNRPFRKALSGLAFLVAMDQLRAFILRNTASVVDSVLPASGPRKGRALRNNVRQNARLPGRAQRHPREHPARNLSRRHRRAIGRSSRSLGPARLAQNLVRPSALSLASRHLLS